MTAEDTLSRFVDLEDEEIPTFRPALDRYIEDVERELERWRSGYEDREALLEGLHRIAFISLGRLDGDFFRAFGQERALVVCFVDQIDEIDDAIAEAERRTLAAVYLRPAIRTAYRRLRRETNEYVGQQDTEPVDADALEFFAARPRMSELYARQARALESFIDGFDDGAAVDRWADRLDLATYAQHDSLLDVEAELSTIERAVLLDETEGAVAERWIQAIEYLLPAFNRSIRRLVAESVELPQQARDGLRPTQL